MYYDETIGVRMNNYHYELTELQERVIYLSLCTLEKQLRKANNPQLEEVLLAGFKDIGITSLKELQDAIDSLKSRLTY